MSDTSSYPDPKADILLYASAVIRQRLDRLAAQAALAATDASDETIHDLRVSIRRFNQSLRAFGQFVPPRAAKRIRKRLRKVMTQAGEVRNRDITLELLRKSGKAEKADVMKLLAAQRLLAHWELLRQVRELDQRRLWTKWQSQLERARP